MPNKKWKIIVTITILLIATIVWVTLSWRQDRQTPAALQQLAKQLAGPHAIDCGQSTDGGTPVESETQFFKVHACAVKAFKEHKNFYAHFEHREFGFFKMLFGLVDNDYVICNPQGDFKLIRWKKIDGQAAPTFVSWSIRDLSNVHITTWGYPGYEPILEYSDDQF